MSELADRPVRVSSEPLLLHWWRLFRWFANLRLIPRWREDNMRLVLRALRRYYYDGLTRPGKILFVCCLLTFLFSYRSSSQMFLLTAATGFALLGWSVLLGWYFRPRVTLQRHSPHSAEAGETVSSQISITNSASTDLNNFTVRELHIPDCRWPKEWEWPYLPRLRRGESASLKVTFIPLKRGRYSLGGLAVQSYFPFFLTRFTYREPLPADLYVLPATHSVAIPSLRKVADLATRRLQQGDDLTRQGPALEYSYSRPYQTGDSLRRLDHRAGSRLGQPMTKLFEGSESIRRDQVYLIIDLSLRNFLSWQRRPVSSQELDHRLALAVEIGRSAQNEGFTLAGLATGDTWHSLESQEEFDRLIATCEPAKTPDQSLRAEEHNLPRESVDERGLYILVLGRWTEEAQAWVERSHKSGLVTLVFLLPESEEDSGSLPSGSSFVEIQSERSR